MKTDIFKIEKIAIFDASLKLLRAGKFQGTPLTEIAFRANMSGRMIDHIFSSREKLLSELSETLTGQIVKLIDEATRKGENFKDRFFDVWTALYKYYRKNPDVIAFLEQFENISFSQDHAKVIHPANSKPLIQLFSNTSSSVGHAEVLAAIFHSNILSTAKMGSMLGSNMANIKPELFSQLLWNGMYGSVNMSEQFFSDAVADRN